MCLARAGFLLESPDREISLDGSQDARVVWVLGHEDRKDGAESDRGGTLTTVRVMSVNSI